LVIDDELLRRGLPTNRATRQLVGREFHEKKGQRWLAEQTIRRVGGSRKIVIDGLRFPEDHTFFVESFGSRFKHVHIVCNDEARRQRYDRTADGSASFSEADTNPVEEAVGKLAQLANQVVDNSGSLPEFCRVINQLAFE
jgi:hypothetical protein